MIGFIDCIEYEAKCCWERFATFVEGVLTLPGGKVFVVRDQTLSDGGQMASLSKLPCYVIVCKIAVYVLLFIPFIGIREFNRCYLLNG